jgi:CHAT domain-containing protein
VSYQDLSSLIRDEFIATDIELFGHGSGICKSDEAGCYNTAIANLARLYRYLYAPVAEELRKKIRLYFVTSKYLSYVPFSALVSGIKPDDTPEFLVESKIITLSRLSFFPEEGILNPKMISNYNIVAVGDPIHTILKVGLKPLKGARVEATHAVNIISNIKHDAIHTLMLGEQATKSAWLETVKQQSYGIMYFATHGVPFAELEFTKSLAREQGAHRFADFVEQQFQNKSHLNGFLYMSYPDGVENGTLTLKNILEMPDSAFSEAELAVLSACNTAVSYSPQVIQQNEIQEALETSAAATDMVDAGWTPGVDQASLVDTFMRRNFRNVYGTLWFAEDTTSSFIMRRFMNNLPQMPAAEALREAQLNYFKNFPRADGFEYALHPFFWACGNIFGQ